MPIAEPNKRYLILSKRGNRTVAVTHTPRKSTQGMPAYLLEVGVCSVELDDTEARTVAELLTASKLLALLEAIRGIPEQAIDRVHVAERAEALANAVHEKGMPFDDESPGVHARYHDETVVDRAKFRALLDAIDDVGPPPAESTHGVFDWRDAVLKAREAFR
jgi:hypothetical protein